MSIFNRIPILSGLLERRKTLIERLTKIRADLDRAETAVAMIVKLETTVPAELARLRALDVCPYIPAVWSADRTFGDDIGGGTDREVRHANSVLALEALEKDLPRLKKHWTLRLEQARKAASAPPEESPAESSSAPAAGAAPQPIAITSFEGVAIADALAMVEAGRITAGRAIELERARRNPRPNLIQQLLASAERENA